MKLKQTLRWQFGDMRNALLIFYAILLAVLILCITGAINFTIDSDIGVDFQGSIIGLEFCSLIFLFVVGICYLDDTLPMLIQNGISRRTIFVGTVISQSAIALGMALFDRALTALLHGLMTLTDTGIEVVPLFDLVFASGYFVVDPPATGLRTLIPAIGFYFLVIAAGMLIYCIYARLHKRGRIAISIAVPGFFVFGLSLLDEAVFHGAISAGMERAAQLCVDLGARLPVVSLGLSLAVTTALWGCTWLLLRRMPIKK